MSLYDRYVLPWIIHAACGTGPPMRQREKLVPAARGRVLEVGFGSGRNLPVYDPDRVEMVFGLDPSEDITRIARKAVKAASFQVELLHAPAEAIPLDDDCVDTVVSTYTLCTIPDAPAALREMARVLRPGGRLLFCEHGAAPDAGVRRWQDRVDSAWGRLSGGCHLNREIPALLTDGGFRIGRLESRYIPGWKPASFTYWGSAETR